MLFCGSGSIFSHPLMHQSFEPQFWRSQFLGVSVFINVLVFGLLFSEVSSIFNVLDFEVSAFQPLVSQCLSFQGLSFRVFTFQGPSFRDLIFTGLSFRGLILLGPCFRGKFPCLNFPGLSFRGSYRLQG